MPVDLCPEFVVPDHSTVSTKRTAYGTVVYVKCDTGYRFFGETRIMALKCVANNRWNTTVRHCEGIVEIFFAGYFELDIRFPLMICISSQQD